jgi:uncharacterized protein (DUF2164 family)
MKKENNIQVTKEKRDEMVSSIKNYFSKEREEELGDLGAGLILEFVIEELAQEFYNQGVYDSYIYMKDTIEDVLSIQKY